MKRPSEKYWERRAAERMVDYMADAEKTANTLGRVYYAVGQYLTGQAEKVRLSFQGAFDLSEAEAKRILAKLPDKSMIDKLKAAIPGITDDKKRKAAEAIISSPAYAYRISRMQNLEDAIAEQCKALYGAEVRTDRAFFAKEIDKAYMHTIYDLHKGTGISSAFDVMPQSRINKILATKWSGEYFSDRVWANTNQLAQGLQNDILVAIMAGKSEKHMADDIMARCGVGSFAARRLVRTETCYIANQAELDGYRECDIKAYIFSAHLDDRTSEICTELDGKTYPLNKARPGVNLPPMHPFCRSTTKPVLPTEEELDAVISELGDEVGADVDFDEWTKALEKTDGGKWIYHSPHKLSGVDNSAESGIIKEEEKSVAYLDLMEGLTQSNIDYRKVENLPRTLTTDEIIERLCGGDLTLGSCSSLGFAYIGNKNGLDVLDFRGGKSQHFFSSVSNIKKMLELPGVKGSIFKVQKQAGDVAKIIASLEPGKEYYLAVGKHAAIVRVTEQGAEYLELQSAVENGWMPFNRYGSMVETLCKRFGCRKTVDKKSIGGRAFVFEKSVILMEVESFKGNKEFQEILGFINTAIGEQQKGAKGSVK